MCANRGRGKKWSACTNVQYDISKGLEQSWRSWVPSYWHSMRQAWKDNHGGLQTLSNEKLQTDSDGKGGWVGRTSWDPYWLLGSTTKRGDPMGRDQWRGYHNNPEESSKDGQKWMDLRATKQVKLIFLNIQHSIFTWR